MSKTTTHALEGTYSLMCGGSSRTPLQQNEDNSSDNLDSKVSFSDSRTRTSKVLGVHILGMKLSGRYMKYRTRALGLNPEKGLLRIFPSLAIGSLPAFNSLPSLTRLVVSLETRVPSKVSSRASWRRKFRDRTEMMVELSLRMRRTVVKTARGPFTKTRIASCGT